jgi:hypothetical protein
VGTVEVSIAGGVTLGEVPLVVVDVAPPPPLEGGGSWWSRAFDAVLDAGGGLVDAIFG